MRRLILTAAMLTLVGCASPKNQLDPGARSVAVHHSNQTMIEQCQYVSEVVGSEGHWYNFFLYNNDALIQGAVNQLKNNARKAGADTVLLSIPMHFTTSVSILASAYRCDGEDKIEKSQ